MENSVIPSLATTASAPGRLGLASQDGFDARTKRLTLLYITALSLVALLCIAGEWLVQISLHRQWSDSTVVNIAGRQRMLSQKLSKAALALLAAKNTAEAQTSLAEIEMVLPLWKRCHQGLQQGDQELGLPGHNSAAVQQMFEKIELEFNAMHSSATQLAAEARLESPLSPDQLARLRPWVTAILAHERSFLAGMDQLVFQYGREASQRVSQLQWIERILLGCTLLVLLLEGLLIFRPAVRQIQHAVVQLRRTSSELQIAKDAAEAANEEKSLFLASMSHELRSPLHAILGSAELTARGPLNNCQREYLEIIDDSSRSLLALVNDLLDLAKIEAGKLELHLEPVDLVLLAHRATAMFTVETERKGLSFSSQIDPQLTGAWRLDGLRLKQVLVNLLNNAVKFTDVGSVGLTLSLEERTGGESWLRCEVCDTGIGIATSMHERIFQAFSQVDGTSSRRFGGAGLGLAICARLVSLMEGQIGVSSEPGSGSKFWLAIPLLRSEFLSVPTELPKPERSYPRLATHSLRVLVAEDAPVNRRVIADMLAELGYVATLAASGGEALEAFAQNSFEVVILDVHMPDRDGYEVAREVRTLEARQNRRRTPIVALTAAAMPQDRQLWQAAGMDAYWTKPVSLEILRHELARILEKGGANLSKSGLQPSSPNALEQLRKRPSLLQELIELFELEAPRLLEQIQTGLSESNAPAIFQASHRLKGQAAAFSGEVLCGILGRVEDAAEAKNLTAIQNEWPQLNLAVQELLRQLRLEMPVAT